MVHPPPDAVRLAEQLARAGREPVSEDERVRLAGEVDALFAAHQDLVYAACLKILHNPELAMEVAQEALLTAYRKLPTFRGDAQFRTWLLKIAQYLCFNAYRKRSEVLADDALFEPADPSASVLTGLRKKEREDLLRESAAAVLDETEQEVVYLWYTEQVPLDRITELLRLPGASGARGVLQRCKRKLEHEVRRRLAEMGHGSSFVRGTIE